MNDQEWEEFLIGAAFGKNGASSWSHLGAQVHARLRAREPAAGAESAAVPGFTLQERQEVLQVVSETGDLSWTALDDDAERVRIGPMIPKDAMRWAEYFGLRMFVSAEAASAYLRGQPDERQTARARRRYFEWLIPAAIAESAASFHHEINTPLDGQHPDHEFDDDIPF